MNGLVPYQMPWNVGEDDAAAVKAALARRSTSPMSQFNPARMAQTFGGQFGNPFAAQAPSPVATVPPHVAQACGAPHLTGQSIEALFQHLENARFNVALPQRGPFDPSGYYNSLPQKAATETLPLSPAVAIAAGATSSLSAVVQKPFQGTKLILTGDLGSFQITSITAAGQTVTAASGEIPASVYENVDSWPNIGFPALTAGASIVIAVRNASGVAANLFGSIRGHTGEG